MRTPQIAAAGLLAIAGLASAQAVPVLSIDDAVAIALKQNRQVQSAALDVSRAQEETAAMKTARLPQFSIFAVGGESLRAYQFNVPQGVLGSYPATGPIPAQNSSITTPRTFTAFIWGNATQPVSQLWKVRLDVISSKLNQGIAKEKLRQQRQTTAQSVRELYYQIVQTQTQIESAQAMVTALVELQRETDQNVKELAALKSDSLVVRARLSQERYRLLNFQDTNKNQKESLNNLLGRDIEIEFSVEAQPLPAPEQIDLAAARDLARRQRPEIQQARLKTDRAETAVRRERAEYIPNVSAGLTYASFPNVSFLPQNLLIAGFVADWQPFDWGKKRHIARALSDGANQAKLGERDAQQQVLLDVNSTFRALAEARVQLDTAALAQEAQREKLRVSTNRYREKAVLLADVLQQETAVVQADSEYQSALAAFWKAKANFDRALGREQ